MQRDGTEALFDQNPPPFSHLAELHNWLVQPPKRLQAQSIYWRQITTQLAAEYPIVFTHGDLAARNILVREGQIVALLDREFAEWYRVIGSMYLHCGWLDNIDWETRHLPLLYTKRYFNIYIPLSRLIPMPYEQPRAIEQKILRVGVGLKERTLWA